MQRLRFPPGRLGCHGLLPFIATLLISILSTAGQPAPQPTPPPPAPVPTPPPLTHAETAAGGLDSPNAPPAPTPPPPTTVGPLPQAHSHNDYLQPRPLLDALDHGFCSVEADIFLVDDRLLVAHEASQIQPDRTLEALYLDPLRERIRARGGHVHTPNTTFHLLVDIKSDGPATYQALDRCLRQYADMLTRFESGRIITNAVTISISGNRPRELLEQQTLRYAAYDGRLADLDSDAAPHLIPLVSDNWRAHFQWRGDGPLSEPERMKLRELVRRAHEQGRSIRFWAHPDQTAGWEALRDAGVDLINTDNLAGLRQFLLETQSR